MTTQISMVSQWVRLRQWVKQVQSCRNSPEGRMDVEIWCSQDNVTKVNGYYCLRRVRKARQSMLDAYPSLQKMYSADDGNTEVFYFKNATATFSSFTHDPEVVKF